MFAAVGTVEPVITDREAAEYLEHEEPWFEQRLRVVEERIRGRLTDLSRRLGSADCLAGAFRAGDLLMADGLRRLGGSVLLAEYSNLSAYVARAEARPAFRRAFDAQRAFFEAHRAASRQCSG
jgi:glutathione S-transferase